LPGTWDKRLDLQCADGETVAGLRENVNGARGSTLREKETSTPVVIRSCLRKGTCYWELAPRAVVPTIRNSYFLPLAVNFNLSLLTVNSMEVLGGMMSILFGFCWRI
jgi:hypothetical protein